MVCDQQLRKSSQKYVESKQKQDGSAKHKQVTSANSTCNQHLTNPTEFVQVTASSYIASNKLKQQPLVSFHCDHRHVLRRSNVCVGG
ncbi:hypothetical protein ACOSP7_012794 [Xanthoceras sorbifolium]